MGCIASIEGCSRFCNLTNQGLECAKTNRFGLSAINLLLSLLGVCFGIVACLGAFSDEDLIKTFPWMTWMPANYTTVGYDGNITVYHAESNSDGISFYSNLWGLTDEYKTAKMAWDKYPGAGTDCADAHLGMLINMGIGLTMSFLALAQVCNRMKEVWDRNGGNKCLMLLTTLVATICNGVAVATYSSECFHAAHEHNMQPAMGIGYYSFVACILVGNLPNFFINLAIPVAEEDDCAGKDEETTPLTTDAGKGGPRSGKKKKKKNKTATNS